MRYVAKIHMLDVMDRVIVSGYVYDADPLTDPDHILHEFTCDTPGRGLSDHWEWLLVHLYQALSEMTNAASWGRDGAGVEGVRHTISESGDWRTDVMG